MTVKIILDGKGRDVITVQPGLDLAGAVELLAKHRIGAVVVLEAQGGIAGVLSERDIVSHIAKNGAQALQAPVSEVMTSNVVTCRERHTINEVMEIMTQRRFRHLPVEEGGKLVGIISIGDVVKQRIRDVEREAEHIKEYIATA